VARGISAAAFSFYEDSPRSDASGRFPANALLKIKFNRVQNALQRLECCYAVMSIFAVDSVC
jgi:hypothetical protein